MARILTLAAAVFVADLLTKIAIRASLPLHTGEISVIGDWVRLIHVENPGSAFSLFQGGRPFFILFSVASILLIVHLARSKRYRTPGRAVALGLILGGALGNLLDRVAIGAVTDWIDVGIGARRWPTFNVADMGVSIGVALLALLLLRSPRGEEVEPEESAGERR